MKVYKELEDLNFFEWLSETHNLADTDMKPEYLDELPPDDIHRTVCNAMAFRWFREKHNLRCQINYIGGLINKTTWWDISVIGHYNTDPKEWEMKYQPYEEAELACLKKLIEIVK